MDNCIFCKIVNGEIPSIKVYENEDVLAFKDINPVAPVHIVVVPKKHISSINALQEEDIETIGRIYLAIKETAKITGIAENGYRVITNCGENAGQTVFHIHFHLIGGKTLNWP